VNPAGLTEAIRASTELGLTLAKNYTEHCLDGEVVFVKIDSAATAARFIETVGGFGWNARIVDQNEVFPDPQCRALLLEDWNRIAEHQLHADDFCRDDSPWCYFVSAPLRSVDAFARSYAWWQMESGSQTVVRMIRGRHCATPQAVFREWSAALQFPYYFGHNWDAFDECITDLDWLPGSCYLFCVTQLDKVLPAYSSDFSICINVLQVASREWKIPNRYNTNEPTAPFTVVFHAEPHKAPLALERLHTAGGDPVKSRLPDALLALSGE
jgi:hypothetical protein